MAEKGKHRRRKKEEQEAEQRMLETGMPPEVAGRQVFPAPSPGQVSPAGQVLPPGGPAPVQAQPQQLRPQPQPGFVQQSQPGGQWTGGVAPVVPAPQPRLAPNQPLVAPPSRSVQPVTPPPEAGAPGQAPTAQAGVPAQEAPAPPPVAPPPGYFYPQPQWYPVPFVPPSFGYGPGFVPPGGYPDVRPPVPVEQTGQIPVPPLVVPMMPGAPVASSGVPVPPMGFPQGPQPPGYPGTPYPQPYAPPQLDALEDEEFGILTEPAPSHWRGDLKWVFGILTALLLFASLAFAGMYRTTSSGASKVLLVPLVSDATQVRQVVKENYRDLRSKARRLKNATILIPDLGVDVSLSASDINSLSSADLAVKVVSEVAQQIFRQGYLGNLPMKAARGTGEERAKAVDATLLSELNKNTHGTLIWPLVGCGVLFLAFGALFLVFCRGWGKAIGAGLVLIAATIPASLWIRVMNEFFWKSGSGVAYKAAMYDAFRNIGSKTTLFFDIALGVGALVLLVGVIGNTMSKRSRSRVPPFVDLQRPAEQVVGGPPVEPGLEAVAPEPAGESVPIEAFRDIAPPPGEAIKNP